MFLFFLFVFMHVRTTHNLYLLSPFIDKIMQQDSVYDTFNDEYDAGSFGTTTDILSQLNDSDLYTERRGVFDHPESPGEPVLGGWNDPPTTTANWTRLPTTTPPPSTTDLVVAPVVDSIPKPPEVGDGGGSEIINLPVPIPIRSSLGNGPVLIRTSAAVDASSHQQLRQEKQALQTDTNDLQAEAFLVQWVQQNGAYAGSPSRKQAADAWVVLKMTAWKLRLQQEHDEDMLKTTRSSRRPSHKPARYVPVPVKEARDFAAPSASLPERNSRVSLEEPSKTRDLWSDAEPMRMDYVGETLGGDGPYASSGAEDDDGPFGTRREQSSDDELDDNEDACHRCGSDEGDLLMCDSCPLSFHNACLITPLVSIQEDQDWQCPVCLANELDEALEKQNMVREFTEDNLEYQTLYFEIRNKVLGWLQQPITAAEVTTGDSVLMAHLEELDQLEMLEAVCKQETNMERVKSLLPLLNDACLDDIDGGGIGIDMSKPEAEEAAQELNAIIEAAGLLPMERRAVDFLLNRAEKTDFDRGMGWIERLVCGGEFYVDEYQDLQQWIETCLTPPPPTPQRGFRQRVSRDDQALRLCLSAAMNLLKGCKQLSYDHISTRKTSSSSSSSSSSTTTRKTLATTTTTTTTRNMKQQRQQRAVATTTTTTTSVMKLDRPLPTLPAKMIKNDLHAAAQKKGKATYVLPAAGRAVLIFKARPLTWPHPDEPTQAGIWPDTHAKTVAAYLRNFIKSRCDGCLDVFTDKYISWALVSSPTADDNGNGVYAYACLRLRKTKQHKKGVSLYPVPVKLMTLLFPNVKINCKPVFELVKRARVLVVQGMDLPAGTFAWKPDLAGILSAGFVIPKGGKATFDRPRIDSRRLTHLLDDTVKAYVLNSAASAAAPIPLIAVPQRSFQIAAAAAAESFRREQDSRRPKHQRKDDSQQQQVSAPNARRPRSIASTPPPTVGVKQRTDPMLAETRLISGAPSPVLASFCATSQQHPMPTDQVSTERSSGPPVWATGWVSGCDESSDEVSLSIPALVTPTTMNGGVTPPTTSSSSSEEEEELPTMPTAGLPKPSLAVALPPPPSLAPISLKRPRVTSKTIAEEKAHATKRFKAMKQNVAAQKRLKRIKASKDSLAATAATATTAGLTATSHVAVTLPALLVAVGL